MRDKDSSSASQERYPITPRINEKKLKNAIFQKKEELRPKSASEVL